MGVIARFRVQLVQHTQMAGPPGENPSDPPGPVEDGVIATLAAVGRKLGPQVDPDDPEAVFGYYTPSGEIKMLIRGAAGEWFRDRLGKPIAVRFEDVD